MLLQSWLCGVQSWLIGNRRMRRATRRRQRATSPVSSEVLEVRSLLAANITATLVEVGGANECPEDAGQNAVQTITADDAVDFLGDIHHHGPGSWGPLFYYLPNFNDLITEDPITEDPVAEDPVAEDPVAEDPIAEDPIAEDPIAEDPIAEDPIAEDPIAEDPLAEDPLAEDPVAEDPVAEYPVAEYPVAGDPVAGDPIDGDPVDGVEPIIFPPGKGPEGSCFPVEPVAPPSPVEVAVGNIPGWSGNTTHTGQVEVVPSSAATTSPDGSPFAILTAGDPNQPVTLSHTFYVHVGDTISGSSFFHAGDYMPYDDAGGVRILDADGDVLEELMSSSVFTVGDFGQTGWISWQFVAQFEGNITIEAWVTNAADSFYDSQVGMANVEFNGTRVDFASATVEVIDPESDPMTPIISFDIEKPNDNSVEANTPSDEDASETIDTDVDTDSDPVAEDNEEGSLDSDYVAALSTSDWIDHV